MKQVSFMCDDDVYDLIETWSHANDRSFSEAIRHGLRMFFASDSLPQKAKPGRKAFLAPSIEEIRSYVIQMHYAFDPEAFLAFYESKGWRIGNQPMRDWRAACTTWQKRTEISPTFAHNGSNGGKPAQTASSPGSSLYGLRRAKDGTGILYQGSWYHPTPDLKRWYTEDGYRPDGTSKMADAKDATLNATIYAAMTEMAKRP
jgi:hypothetical protein